MLSSLQAADKPSALKNWRTRLVSSVLQALGHFFAAFFAPTRLVVGERGPPGVTAGNIRTISTSTSRLALGKKPTACQELFAIFRILTRRAVVVEHESFPPVWRRA